MKKGRRSLNVVFTASLCIVLGCSGQKDPTTPRGAVETVAAGESAVSPPTAAKQSLKTAPNTPLTITLIATASDGESDSLTYEIAEGPEHGTLGELTGATVTYTPTSGFKGKDEFTFKAGHGAVSSEVAAISIEVTAPSDNQVAEPLPSAADMKTEQPPAADPVAETPPPAADNQNVETQQEKSLPITLTATASDGANGSLTFVISKDPEHGGLSGAPPTVTYDPEGGFHGDDSFQFTARQGAMPSAPATVTITVIPTETSKKDGAGSGDDDEDGAGNGDDDEDGAGNGDEDEDGAGNGDDDENGGGKGDEKSDTGPSAQDGQNVTPSPPPPPAPKTEVTRRTTVVLGTRSEPPGQTCPRRWESCNALVTANSDSAWEVLGKRQDACIAWFEKFQESCDDPRLKWRGCKSSAKANRRDCKKASNRDQAQLLKQIRRQWKVCAEEYRICIGS